jgi:hypothetical protein
MLMRGLRFEASSLIDVVVAVEVPMMVVVVVVLVVVVVFTLGEVVVVVVVAVAVASHAAPSDLSTCAMRAGRSSLMKISAPLAPRLDFAIHTALAPPLACFASRSALSSSSPPPVMSADGLFVF